MTLPKVLMSAYACEPGLGSEAGIGWNWVEQACQFTDLWVITRINNRDAIESRCRSGPLARVRWIYFDLPTWARWWKRGPRGTRLYYALWQAGAHKVAKRLHSEVRFDLVHHVTFGSYWMPTFLSRLPVPFIWGPVGGGESTPATFYPTFSTQGRLAEHLRDLGQSAFGALPEVRATAHRAKVALATTEATAQRLHHIGARQVRVMTHTALPRVEYEQLRQTPFRNDLPLRFVSIGRMLHWKGYSLGLSAFARFYHHYPQSEYWLIGEGPERRRLERDARRLNIADSVRFLGQLRRSDVLSTIRHCDVLVHPSFHDSGGYVCVEMMAAGRPVICLDLGGPGLLVDPDCGFRIPAENPTQAVTDISEAMCRLASDAVLRQRLGTAAKTRVREHFLWEQNGVALRRLYLEVLAVSGELAPRPADVRRQRNASLSS